MTVKERSSTLKDLASVRAQRIALERQAHNLDDKSTMDDVDGITASLKAAEFSSVTAERISHNAVIKDIKAFAKALIFGNPIADEMRNLGGNPDEAVEVVEAAIIKEFGPDQSMPLEAVVFTAKC